MAKSYYTYVLQCADKTLYCGYTDDVEKRLAAHNAGKGAKYTHSRRPVKLLTYLEFPDKNTAMQCEWWFKNKFTRKKKFQLIETNGMKTAFEKWQESRGK